MKRSLLALVTVLCLLLAGCFFPDAQRHYSLWQAQDQIETIEIVEIINVNDYNNFILETVNILDKSIHPDIINQILSADGNYVTEGAGFSLDSYAIRVTYKDGATELIGELGFRRITAEGEIKWGGYWFDSKGFQSIISQYMVTAETAE